MAKKRSDTNSVAGAVGAMLDAAKPAPAIPAHVSLRARDLPFWNDVVCARGPSEWTKPELVAAAQLARCQSDIEVEQIELDAEGSVLTNEKGTRVANPRFAILETLARREMALFRTLTLNATSRTDARQIKSARQTYQGAVQARSEIEDDLIAR